MMTGYLFYTQYLVIWYGNIPEETRYVIKRTQQDPWSSLSWTILAMCFVLPFFALLFRKLKTHPKGLVTISLFVLVGMWFERFFLVVPSLWKSQGLPLGFPEFFVTAGFLGAVGLTVTLFLRKVSLLPVGDPLFQEEMERVWSEVEEEKGSGQRREAALSE